MGLFYPSLAVTLRIRFDSSFRVLKENAQGVVSVEDLVLQPRAVQSAVLDPLLGAFPQERDDFSHIVYISPFSASVELPGYRQAGKFNLSFRWRELPIDPRVVKACGVEIHLGSVTPDDFAIGMTRKESNWRRRSVIDIRDSLDSIRPDTIAMVGTVDSWTVDFEDSGGTVSIEGRDNRGILLDANFDPEMLKKIDVSKDIKSVIEQILSFHPLFGPGFSRDGGNRIKVKAYLNEFKDGRLPLVLEDDLTTRVNEKARVAKEKADAAAAKAVKAGKAPRAAHPKGDHDKMNYWDLITHYCYLVGVIPTFLGEDILLRPVRNLYDMRVQAGSDPSKPTPFKNGAIRSVQTEDGVQHLRLRRLVYGRDVQNLKFERKIGGVKGRAIQVYSVNTSSNDKKNRMIDVIWPPEADPAYKKVSSEDATGQGSEEEILVIHLSGITSKQRLEEIAQAIYEELNRSEIGGSCTTKTLSSFGGSNEDPDMLRLRPGDAVQFLVDTRALNSRSPLVSAITDFNRMPFDEAVNAVVQALGNNADLGDNRLARVLVATARGLVFELSTFFRVNTVRFNWSIDAGVEISFDFHNYVEVRQQERTTEDLLINSGDFVKTFSDIV